MATRTLPAKVAGHRDLHALTAGAIVKERTNWASRVKHDIQPQAYSSSFRLATQSGAALYQASFLTCSVPEDAMCGGLSRRGDLIVRGACPSLSEWGKRGSMSRFSIEMHRHASFPWIRWVVWAPGVERKASQSVMLVYSRTRPRSAW